MIPPRPNLDDHEPVLTYIGGMPDGGRSWDLIVMGCVCALMIQTVLFVYQWRIARALWIYWGW